MSINFVDQANAANHYTTPPPGTDPTPNLEILLFIIFRFLDHFVYVANLLRTWESFVIDVVINASYAVRSAFSATAGLFVIYATVFI